MPLSELIKHEPKRQPLEICGRIIGTCSGWDEQDTLTHIYHEVQIDPTLSEDLGTGPFEYVEVNYESGRITTKPDDENAPERNLDLLSALKNAPKASEAPMAPR